VGPGYWLAGADGSVYPVGRAPALGSLAGRRLAAPIVGIAATLNHKGYWLVAGDGGVFSFGDAPFYSSLGGKHLSAPIVAGVVTPDRMGYRLLGRDGAVYALGSARYEGGAKDLLVGPAAIGL
jgi:hypothetical protein